MTETPAVQTEGELPEGTNLVILVSEGHRGFGRAHLYLRRGFSEDFDRLDPEDDNSWKPPYTADVFPTLMVRDEMGGYLPFTVVRPTGTLTVEEVEALPDRSVVVVANRHDTFNDFTVLQRIHSDWWNMEDHFTEQDGETYTHADVVHHFGLGHVVWSADFDNVPDAPEKPRVPTFAEREAERAAERAALEARARAAVLAAIPAPAASERVPEWPEDEREFFREGYMTDENPAGWNSFTDRHEKLDVLRREKATDAVLAALREVGALSF